MKAIVAMSLNRVIGKDGKIPWYFPEDLKFFRKKTTNPHDGGYLLMGRKTFEDVGILPKRFIYIMTKNTDLRGLLCRGFRYCSEDDWGPWITKHWGHLWLVGGAQMYERYIHECEEVYVTIVLDEYEGDAFMPDFEHLFPNSEIIKETKNYWIELLHTKYVLDPFDFVDWPKLQKEAPMILDHGTENEAQAFVFRCCSYLLWLEIFNLGKLPDSK
jgi:dihydrofolate reductase